MKKPNFPKDKNIEIKIYRPSNLTYRKIEDLQKR